MASFTEEETKCYFVTPSYKKSVYENLIYTKYYGDTRVSLKVTKIWRYGEFNIEMSDSESKEIIKLDEVNLNNYCTEVICTDNLYDYDAEIVDIDKYIKLSDIYLFPSKLEGLGTPILEAQACGIPVVSNLLKDITNTEIIEGEGGYCSILNPKEFALKIEMALNIPEDTLIKNAKYTINRASTKVIDEGYCKIMKELMYD